MEFLQLSQLIIGIVGIILGLIAIAFSMLLKNKDNPFSSFKIPIIHFKIPNILIIIVITVLIISLFIQNTQSLIIIKPSMGEVIKKCELIDASDKKSEVRITVLVKTNKKISNNEFITLFLKVKDGEEWWVSSNQITANEMINNNIAIFSFVTIGKKGDGNKIYYILAAITKKKFNPGVTIKELPEDIKVTDTIRITKDC